MNAEARDALASMLSAKLASGPPQRTGWRRETDVDGTRYGLFEYRCKSGRVVSIEERFSSTGTRVWDTAVAMARMFEKRGVRRGTRILELGAGTGLLGMVLATIGATVTSTDAGSVLETLQEAASRNASDVHVRELDWTKPRLDDFVGFDMVVASDVLICEQWALALARVVVALGIDVYVGTVSSRDGIKPFLTAVGHAFQITTLPVDAFDPDFASDDIIVFQLKKVAT